MMIDRSDSHVLATIGVLMALPKEYAAFELMLDDAREWRAPGAGAGRRFLIGKIPSDHGEVHVIAAALLPDMGNNAAAIAADRLLERFPNVRHIIMCGIAGGAPIHGEIEHDVRLGDIVVSNRNGVVQYDIGKEIADGLFEVRYPPRPPGAELLEAVRYLIAGEEVHRRPWESLLDRGQMLKNGVRPADNLNAKGVPVEYPMDSDRQVGLPRVFHGTIAASNRLLKNAEHRNELRDKFGVKAIEMESSGIADATWSSDRAGYLTVRGICDYCDEHKGDAWQGAAAIAAAAYTRTLIASMHAQSIPDSVDRVAQRSDFRDSESRSGEILNEVPVGTNRFVGREDELSRLIGALSATKEGTSLIAITGMGGAGKSTLAAEVARQCCKAGLFPDGIVWHDAGDTSPHRVMSHVLEALASGGKLEYAGIASTAMKNPEMAFKRAMQSLRILIVLDGGSAATDLQPLLTNSRGSAILFTSRDRISLLKSKMSAIVELTAMTEEDAISLLRSMALVSPPEETQPLRDVADLCGRLPLALSIAGALLSDRAMWPSIDSFRARLAQSRLDCLSFAGGESTSLRSVLRISYQSMEPEEARLFRGLAALGRRSFGASAVSTVLARDKNDTIISLSKLIQRSVLERSSIGTYVLHELLRELARELLWQDETEEEVQSLLHRAHTYWTSLQEAVRIGGLAASHATNSSFNEAIKLYSEALELNRVIQDRKGESLSLSGIAAAHANLGEPRTAIHFYENALALNREIGDRKSEASTQGGIAAAYAKLGDFRKAIEHYEADQRISREFDDRKGEASALGGIAAAYSKLGDSARAIENYEEALKLNRELSNPKGEASALAGLATVHASRGDMPAAIRLFDEVLRLNREIGDRKGEASTLGGIAAANAKLGEFRKAIEHYDQAQRLNREIGDRKGEASALGGIAAANAKLGEFRKAIEHYDQAQRLNREIGDRKGEASALGGIAAANAKLGEFRKAIESYEADQKICHEIGDRKGEASAVGGMAAAYSKLGNARKALEHLEKALDLNRAVGNRWAEAQALGGISAAHERLKNYPEAVRWMEEALKLNRNLRNQTFIRRSLEALCRLGRKHGKPELVERCEAELRTFDGAWPPKLRGGKS